MSDYGTMEFNLDEINEASGGNLPPPAGTYLCRIECDDLAPIGQSLGFKIKGTVVERNYCGHVVEDVLWISDKAMGRIKMALHRVAGITSGKLSAAAIKEALDGKLARLTVEKVIYNVKGDSSTEYTEAQAMELRARGEKVYGRAKLAFAGYEAATAKEIAEYSTAVAAPAARGAAPQQEEKLPF
jgi:hypothetical protein